MGKNDPQDFRKLSATSSADTYEDFGRGFTGLYVVSDADVFLNVDAPAVPNGGSMLVKANLQPVYLQFMGNTVHVKTASSTANVYVTVIRQQTSR